jgi:hypothetical protein
MAPRACWPHDAGWRYCYSCVARGPLLCECTRARAAVENGRTTSTCGFPSRSRAAERPASSGDQVLTVVGTREKPPRSVPSGRLDFEFGRSCRGRPRPRTLPRLYNYHRSLRLLTRSSVPTRPVARTSSNAASIALLFTSSRSRPADRSELQRQSLSTCTTSHSYSLASQRQATSRCAAV